MGHAVQDEYLDTVRRALAPRFRVEQEIGRGGMATVFLAEDLKLRRPVAIKILRPELTASLGADRFLREIAIASKLSHPCIVPLHDSGSAAGLLYYVMPYIEGESLRQRLTREKQLSLDEATRITRDVASALDAAHAQGVIHRDIKPGNILLEAGHAMVTDFGLARALAHSAGDSITSSGLIMGTPEYMSPEQAAGASDLDARTDVYSLACVLYEMLTGEAPYTGPTVQAIVAKQLSQPVPSARVVRGTIPPGIDAAIQRGLAKVPADRFGSAQEFEEALSHPQEARHRLRHRQLGIVAAGLIGMGVAAVLLGPIKLFNRGGDGTGAAYAEPTVHVGILPVAVRGGQADSIRIHLVEDLLLSELARYRGLSIVDPVTLASQLGASGSKPGADPVSVFRRLGLQYAVRITTTRVPGGLEVSCVLTEARTGDIVETAVFTNSEASQLQTQVRQAGGRLVVALEAATGGLAKGLDVAPFLTRAHNAAAVGAFLRGIEYTYRFLPGGGEHFERALELDHDFIGPRVFLVSGRAAAGDTAAARPQVRVLDSLKPQATPFEQSLIGWCESVVRGDVDGKIRHLRVALAYAPHNNFLLYNLADNLWATGRTQEAVELAREAMRSGWRFAPLYTLWVKLAIESGSIGGLRDTLETARGFAPPDPYSTGLLEALALFESDTNAARRYATAFRAELGDARIVRGYAELSHSYLSLAQRARSQRRSAVAVALLRRPVDAGVAQPLLRLELARVMAESGNRKAADSYYRAAAGIGIADADALAMAGEVAELLGLAVEARTYFTRYLEVAPDGPDAVRVRERLRAIGGPARAP